MMDRVNEKPVKKLLRALLKSLLSYFSRMIQILKSPRRTIGNLCGNEPEKLRSAFSFFILTLFIGAALRAPLLAQEQDFLRITGSLLVIRIVAVLMFAGVIQWLFSICRGQGSYQQTLCASLYISSPAYLLLVMVHLAGAGILASQDLGLAEVWNAGQTHTAGILKALQEKAPLAHLAFLTITALRLVATTLWLLICWDIYQDIHRVSRSSLAMTYSATILLWCVYWLAMTLIMKHTDLSVVSHHIGQLSSSVSSG